MYWTEEEDNILKRYSGIKNYQQFIDILHKSTGHKRTVSAVTGRLHKLGFTAARFSNFSLKERAYIKEYKDCISLDDLTEKFNERFAKEKPVSSIKSLIQRLNSPIVKHKQKKYVPREIKLNNDQVILNKPVMHSRDLIMKMSINDVSATHLAGKIKEPVKIVISMMSQGVPKEYLNQVKQALGA